MPPLQVAYLYMTISLRIKHLMGGMTQVEFAQLIGEEKPQRLKDVLRGHQKIPEDMHVRMIERTGCDANWLLLGAGAKPVLNPRAQALLDNYEALSDEAKRHVEGTVNLLAQPQGVKRRA